jgi:hypothetical protein
MHPEIEQARVATAERFARELAACDELIDFVHRIVRPWKGRPLDPQGHPHDNLVAALFARSFTSFWAAVELVRMGFGEQAAMVNRALFEDMVDAHWICTEPERAVELYEAHLTHGQMLLGDQIAKYPQLYGDLVIPDFDAAERERLDGLFGRYGTKSWTLLAMHDRVTAVEHHWGDEENRVILRFFRDIPHRENNQTLHVSGQGLTALVRDHGSEGLALRLGPSSEMLERGLFGAYWIFQQTLGLLLEHFEFANRGRRCRRRAKRPLPLRQREEVQALPRRVGRRRRS